MSPKARPLTVAELVELRELTRELRGLVKVARELGQYVPASQAAAMMGFKSVRTLLDLVREGHFPGAWKPAANRLHLRVDEVIAYIEARRVQAPALEDVHE